MHVEDSPPARHRGATAPYIRQWARDTTRWPIGGRLGREGFQTFDPLIDEGYDHIPDL